MPLVFKTGKIYYASWNAKLLATFNSPDIIAPQNDMLLVYNISHKSVDVIHLATLSKHSIFNTKWLSPKKL